MRWRLSIVCPRMKWRNGKPKHGAGTRHILRGNKMTKENDFNEPGQCFHCGNGNIEYTGGADIDGNCCIYKYFCKDCGESGREVYNLEFVENVDINRM